MSAANESSTMGENHGDVTERDDYSTLLAVGGAVVGATGAVMAAPAVLAAAGFTAAGVAAGSLAAAAQATMGGVVAKGSLFALCQSWGAAGLPLAAKGAAATQQIRPDAVALPSTCRSAPPLFAPRYVMFIRRAWGRLRKSSNAGVPYAAPGAVCDAAAGARTSSATSGGASNADDKTAGGTSARATSLMAGMAAVSSVEEERMQWRRAGRDRRRTWGFRKLKTRSDSAVSSPEATEATLKQTPTNVAADAGVVAEGASPTADKTDDQSPQAGLVVAHEPNPSAAAPAPGADDYACLAEDDINWSTGYVKLCYMPDALNQECSSFQDLRKGPYDFSTATVQSQVVVERFHGIEQRVNLRDGRSVFGETTERICYGRNTSQVAVFDGNGTSEQSACELMTFDTNATVVLQRSVTVAEQNHSSSQCTEPQTSQPGVTDNAACVTASQDQQKVHTTSTTNCVVREPSDTRLYQTETLVSGNHCPVGLLIQPQQQQQHDQHCWGNFDDSGADRGRATTQRPEDSLFNSGSFLYALRHSPSTNFPRPHPPSGHQPHWRGDRGSLENYAARGDFSAEGAWNHHRHRLNASRERSGSGVSSEDDSGVMAARRSSAKASLDDRDVADIFMFSEDDDDDLCVDEDLCADGGNAVAAAPMRPGSGNNQNFEVNLGSREAGGAAAGHRVVEDGSGDNRDRIELAVRI
ncbi:hypothetical protein HPB51_008491 [Rhipicephalus microplus]|uniref:Transmembrane protein n=1 Tax=Rhipicephalus microplus TaxID=6941 RepID=A0A9J6ERC4_RHIMP|nr:hypothetical protein HPB51_008491 [Rhipicephalus microplus]